MKNQGNCILGDPVRIDKFTASWPSVKVHPAVFYRRIQEFHESFSRLKGLYTEIDIGNCVIIRFSEKDDLTTFHKMHHCYV